MTCDRCNDIHCGQLNGNSNKSCQCGCHDKTKSITSFESKSIAQPSSGKRSIFSKPSKVSMTYPKQQRPKKIIPWAENEKFITIPKKDLKVLEERINRLEKMIEDCRKKMREDEEE